jgi:general secretion pathway protein M
MVIPIFERWGLNPREQRVATLAVIVFGVMLVLGVVGGLSMTVSSRSSEIDELKNTLAMVQAARGSVRERQSKKDSIAMRYQTRAPTLGGYLEQTATKNHLEVSDSVDRPDVPHGKKYTERSTVIHLKKAGMLNIAKFLEAIEKSPYPLSVSRLNIRKRTGEPDSYDVEVGISAYDRQESTPAAAGSAHDADKDKKP